MYIHFHTHLWTDGDPIALSCLNKIKKKKKQGLVSTYELHKKIRIMVQMFEFVQEILALKSVI